MRLIAILVCLVVAIAGIVFGALNADMVSYDLLFTQLSLPKGGVVLAMLLAGWVLGGVMVWLLVVQPLKFRLRRATRQVRKTDEPGTAIVASGRSPESA